MAEKNQDLGITQKQDGQYWDIVVPGLDPNTNYAAQFAWVYADKTKGNSEFSDFFEFSTPAPRRTCPINVSAIWDDKANLTVSFEKPFLADGVTRDNRIKLFQLTISATGEEPIFTTVAVKENVDVYTWKLSQQDNMANFGNQFQTTLTGKITSIYGDGSSDDCLFDIPVYVDPICAATGLAPTVISANNGILVSWQDPATNYGTYRETRVYVSENNNPYLWELRYTGFGPASITLDTLNTVYVKINHLSDSGCESIDSPVVEGKAFDPFEFDNTPPDPVINPSASWSGTDLIISFTMPAQNVPTYVKVHLTSSGSTEYFEKTVSGSAASANTSVKISRTEFIDGFGFSPSSFTGGYVTDLDIYRNENITQVNISNITSVVKPNPLAGKTTTISVTSMANGYVVSSNLDSKATGIKVYQSSTENGTYTLVASSNSSPVIVYDESSAGSTVWVKAQWTSEDGNAEMSAATSVLILDVGALSIIENPIKIKTDGSIFAGTLDSNDEPVLTGARAVFNKRGFFLYDDNDANGLNPTTQIIGEDNGVTATFITKKAKIANWVISDSKIENTLNAAAGSYTGLSPSGTYAFWAGGGVAGGYSVNINEDAKFSVTKEGSVIARNIKVLGGEIQVGSKFKVNTQGDLEATNVKLSGEIKAASGILGNVEIGGTIDGTTYSGQLLIDAANGSKVEIGKYNSGDINNPVLGFSGIQVTGANGKYVQLDPVSGIIANKGTIAGWTIDSNSINKAGNVGFYAPTGTPQANDIMIWAGTSRTGNPGPNFSVTYSGSLIAKEATLYGSIEARAGYFGEYSTVTKTITEGWKINGKFLQSFSDQFSDVKVKLDGLQGTIAGGNIVGSNMFFMDPNVWYTTYPGSGSGNPGNVDYISSSGSFRLGGGSIVYNSSTDILEVNPTQKPYSTFKIRMNVVSDENGTFGDSTVVQNSAGYLTTGRAFYYGGNNYPDGATSRATSQDPFGRAFVAGDIWLSRKA